MFVYRGADEDFTLENGGGIANLAFVVGKQSVAVIEVAAACGRAASCWMRSGRGRRWR